jgi:hypothetical protein
MSLLKLVEKLKGIKPPPAIEKQCEYVGKSKLHQHRAYVMQRPYTRDNPSKAQRQLRYLFGKASFDARNKFGTVFLEDVGKEVPKTALAVRERLKGLKLAPPKPPHIFPPEVIKMIMLKEAMARLAAK